MAGPVKVKIEKAASRSSFLLEMFKFCYVVVANLHVAGLLEFVLACHKMQNRCTDVETL